MVKQQASKMLALPMVKQQASKMLALPIHGETTSEQDARTTYVLITLNS